MTKSMHSLSIKVEESWIGCTWDYRGQRTRQGWWYSSGQGWPGSEAADFLQHVQVRASQMLHEKVPLAIVLLLGAWQEGIAGF